MKISVEDVIRIFESIKQLQTKNKRLREALGAALATLILCQLIDKSGQATKSVEVIEQALKEDK